MRTIGCVGGKITKLCSKCKLIKLKSCFSKNSRSKDGYDYWCKECKNEYAKNYHLLHPLERYNRRRAFAAAHPHRLRASRSLSYHRYKGDKINISVDDAEELFAKTTHCNICGCKLNVNERTKVIVSNSPSLDRINNENELRIDNVWIICNNCNITKSSRTLNEFIDYCEFVYKKFRRD